MSSIIHIWWRVHRLILWVHILINVCDISHELILSLKTCVDWHCHQRFQARNCLARMACPFLFDCTVVKRLYVYTYELSYETIDENEYHFFCWQWWMMAGSWRKDALKDMVCVYLPWKFYTAFSKTTEVICKGNEDALRLWWSIETSVTYVLVERSRRGFTDRQTSPNLKMITINTYLLM
jgi:hypothetical protein